MFILFIQLFLEQSLTKGKLTFKLKNWEHEGFFDREMVLPGLAWGFMTLSVENKNWRKDFKMIMIYLNVMGPIFMGTFFLG